MLVPPCATYPRLKEMQFLRGELPLVDGWVVSITRQQCAKRGVGPWDGGGPLLLLEREEHFVKTKMDRDKRDRPKSNSKAVRFVK